MMRTVTLFKIIQSELIKDGHSEFETETPPTDIFPFGKFAFFNKDYKFTEKIMNFDDDKIKVLSYIFHGLKLDDPVHDEHFKKMFLYRFVNRQINIQTIESFKMELMNVFLTNKDYINRVYKDIELFILQKIKSKSDNKQKNNQKNNSKTLTDNRQAFADLPQSTANLDVESSIMQYATDNTISKNRQNTESNSDGETVGNSFSDNDSYSLDELIKSSHVMEDIMRTFDSKCFLQVW